MPYDMATISRPILLAQDSLFNRLLAWTQQTSDNIDRVNAPQNSRCSLYFANAYSVAAAPPNLSLPFDSVDYASGEMSNSDGNTAIVSPGTGYGIVCAKAGIVQASYGVELAASAAGTARRSYLQLARLGTGLVGGRQVQAPSATAPFGASGSLLVQVQAGDVIGLVVQQDSGGALALSVGGKRCNLSAFYVAFT